jgi:hypothetical protein
MAREFDTKIVAFLDKKIIATKLEIISHVNCSGATVADALKRSSGYLTSYTHNRKYYALISNLEFDESGSYFYKGVGFRKKGTLKNTILDKINTSVAGIRSLEIDDMLGKVGRDVLARLHVAKKISSQQFGKVRYYFNIDHEVRISQLAERERLYEIECNQENIVNHETILAIVGVCLRTSNLSAKKVLKKLKRMGFLINLDEVHKIMKLYELENSTKSVKKNFG